MYVGECACGDLIMEIDGEPDVSGICHCDNCKRRTGSAFGVSAWFDQDDIGLIAGETVRYSFSSDLGGQERHFCARCGTTLFWTLEALPGRVGVASGCFTTTPLPDPTFEAVAEGKCDWVRLPDYIVAGLPDEEAA